jgi:penicillin-binding protein 2
MFERKHLILFLVGAVALVYALQLMGLQVLDASYRDQADKNIRYRNVLQPLRGMIYDRDGRLLAASRPVFDLYVIPKELKIADTTVFCEFFGISLDYLRSQLQLAKEHSHYQPSLFIKQLTYEGYARIEDRLNEFPGIFSQAYTVREYPHNSLANVLGYVKEVDRGVLEKDTTNYYRAGDLIGKSGLEAHYESYLRGRRGVQYEMRNVRGVIKGKYLDGRFDTVRVIGHSLVSSIDLELQQYAEQLMQHKKGAVVAIEPATGEVLVMLSAPSYDPNLLTGEGDTVTRNYARLVMDPHKPLFNRAIMSTYPPGSTFKTMMALIGLQDGAMDTIHTRYACIKSIVNCHNHPGPLNVFGSIQHSCNPFYFQAYKKIIPQDRLKEEDMDTRIGLESWRYHLHTFGLGRPLGIDIPFEKAGTVPATHYYDRKYRGVRNWKLGNTYSISIGQGEVGTTPLQLANAAATIANRGWYIPPHLIKQIGSDSANLLDDYYRTPLHTSIKKDYFDFVARAMHAVVRAGTARRADIADIQVCGKTGTAQNPHGKDHSVFMAFAPLHEPKIAIAVYVENAGFGGTWAAPIASLLIEKYLKGEISRQHLEDYVLAGHLLEEE